MMKTMITRFLAAPLAAALTLSVLCGCAPAGTSGTGSSPVSSHSVEASAPAETPAPKPSDSAGSTVRDRFERAKEQAGMGSPSGTPGTTDAPSQGKAAYDVKKISELMSMTADVEDSSMLCTVYVDDDHNPYDVTWDYGDDYQAFVDAVGEAGMWDVLFDAEFYKESYPMLSLQYHGDERLLLEQFQTVGVHEGRQGSEAFNVAAYMESCDPDLVGAFGDHYECYYFYWALNQDTESKISTVSDGHPLQMCVKLTMLQRLEFKNVNKYREEAGVDPVELDPEFLAFAAYRAQLDFTGDYTAHEWLEQHNDDAYDYLAMMGSDTLTENTVCGKCSYGGPRNGNYYLKYYNSPEHYSAMVSRHAAYFGCSNAYWGSDGNGRYRHCQYDVYTRGLSTYMNP